MKIALLSFVTDPPSDPLGDLVLARLAAHPDVQVLRETLRPDLGRLKGLLLAAMADPRFEAIVVIADLPPLQSDALVTTVEGSLQQPLPAWQPLVAQSLWELVGSDALWVRSCLGKSQRRLLAALTGGSAALERVLDQLLIPQLPRLLEWATR